jgi:hypothetical protein
LDLERQRAKTPLGACIQLHSLMWAGLHRLRKELDSASRKLAESQPPVASAKIIPLAPRRRARETGQG